MTNLIGIKKTLKLVENIEERDENNKIDEEERRKRGSS